MNVSSEVGRLRRVLVHTPGPELLAVTPENRRAYLYDDILDLDGARQEHNEFAALLSEFAQVDEIRDLLTQTLEQPEAREYLLEHSQRITANARLASALGNKASAELADCFIQGWSLQSGPFAQVLEQEHFVLPPLPNLFFTRDAAVALGERVLISSMRFPSRWPEELLLGTIFRFHPELAGAPLIYDGSQERRFEYSIEGGDVHPLSPDVLLVGLSERTTVAVVDELTETLFEQTTFTDILALVLPQHVPAIHLDMVWTQLDRDLCLVYPTIFRGPRKAPVLHRRKGEASVREPASLSQALIDVGLPMEPVLCGGDTHTGQAREQWGSGCNMLAVAPGKVLSYSRNDQTLAAMEDAGFKVVPAADVVSKKVSAQQEGRFVYTFSGAELVRGGGGPRCMSCPLERDPAW